MRRITDMKKRNIAFYESRAKNTFHKNLDFAATEQYKLLRANLSFTLPDDVSCPVIGVTSSERGEGKSTTAVNLSYVLAESGKQVLLIDADLRIPSISDKMDIKNSPGLTNLLMGTEPQRISAFKSEVLDNWFIIPSGDLPPNPSELLGSRKMEKLLNILEEKFDYIVIDLPPVNIVSDVVAVSRLLDGIVLVVRADYTEKKEFDACVRQLNLSNINVLGCILNDEKLSGFSHYKYNKYYKSYYKKPQK